MSFDLIIEWGGEKFWKISLMPIKCWNYLHPSPDSSLDWSSLIWWSFRFTSWARVSKRCLFSRNSLSKLKRISKPSSNHSRSQKQHMVYLLKNTYLCAAKRSALVRLSSSPIACLACISLCKELCSPSNSILSRRRDRRFLHPREPSPLPPGGCPLLAPSIEQRIIEFSLRKSLLTKFFQIIPCLRNSNSSVILVARAWRYPRASFSSATHWMISVIYKNKIDDKSIKFFIVNSK